MKKRRDKVWNVLLCATMATALLAGCGSGSGSTEADVSAGNEGTVTSADAGKIDISVCGGSEDAMDINTGSVGTLAGLSACRHLYEGLYKLDVDGNVVLGQAEKVDVSEDGLTYTFTLRDDITWSDGQEVTASDFVYGWQFLKDSSGDYSDLLNMVGDAQATDDKTLVVTLNYQCSYLDSVLAFPSAYPVREDIVEEYGESYATDPDKAVYNGSYELTDWTHQESMVMTARADYYAYDALGAETVTWELMSDTSTMLAAFQSGDIIYSDSYPEEEAAALDGNGLTFTSGYNTYCVMFNLGDNGPEVLKDEKVREALSLSIDRERLISIRNLGDELATTYTPSGLTDSTGTEFNTMVTPWYDADTYDANCEKAKQLLADAGYADGEGFPALTYIVNNDDRKEIAEAIVSDWKDILGIDSITVETVESFFAQREDGDYDIAYYGWYMDYPDISNMLSTMTTGSSDAGYSSEAYDSAYNAAISETDETAQLKDYAECEELLSSDLPIVPLLHSQNSYLFDSEGYDGLVYYCGNFYFGYVHEK